MSGSAGARGYLLQSIACLLDGLQASSEWEEVALEPATESEKVDIVWRKSKGGVAKAVQVKSSQNQIGKKDVETWAAELERSSTAEEYELVLLGPCSQSVASLGRIGKVRIPTPRAIDPVALVEQAAHRLDRYLEERGITRVPSFARELIVSGLVTKLATYSTSGVFISRADFERTIKEWILVLYPRVLNDAVAMQCDLLVDTVILSATKKPSLDNIPIVLPITFVNGGVRTAIVEWVAVKVIAADHAKLYTPVALIDLDRLIQGRHKLHGENTKSPFVEFAALANQALSLNIAFTQEPSHSLYPRRPWSSGACKLEVYAKYRDRQTALLQREIPFELTPKAAAEYQRGATISNSIRKIEI